MIKKYMFFLAILLLFSGKVKAANINGEGETISFSAFASEVVSSQKIENLKWADGGFTGGIQIRRDISPYLALGLEFSINEFGDADNYSFNHSVNEKLEVSSWQFMFSSRLTFNPQNNFHIYVPFAIGPQRTQVKYTGFINGVRQDGLSFSEKDSDLAYYVGVGLEKETEEHGLIGMEAKYHSFNFGLKNRTFHPYYYTIALKIGQKF